MHAAGTGEGRGARGLTSVAPLLAQPRYEVFPAASVEDQVTEWVPRGMTVTVTASPAKGLDATLDLTERLAGARLPGGAALSRPGWSAMTPICATSWPG